MKYLDSGFIGVSKTNTKVFYNDTINNMTKYWPGRSCVIFEINPMVTNSRLPFVIEKYYNSKNNIFFIETDGSWRTKRGTPYSYN